ncbi:hypothetical protein OSO01_30690 [Oceanobacillus sojae]|uniref:Uncharacterized protein n=1 Tax=Oceanobacillus sojae TaxID=582851 RepID=A0A511ZLP8_9BACI|nr:hypothetical protein OSO01_30690 [Oceanobacillus sojae]
MIFYSQTIYGSLVETFGPYFQIYIDNQNTNIKLFFNLNVRVLVTYINIIRMSKVFLRELS